MLLHDQPGGAVRLQSVQPLAQQIVEHGLSDPHRRVAVDSGKTDVIRNLVRMSGPDVGSSRRGGVLAHQLQGPLVYIHRPDGRGRGPRGEGHRDRTVPAPQVEDVTPRGWARRFTKEDHRARIDPGRPPSEDSPIGGEIDLQIGKGEPHRASLRSHGRFLVEVVRTFHEAG